MFLRTSFFRVSRVDVLMELHRIVQQSVIMVKSGKIVIRFVRRNVRREINQRALVDQPNCKLSRKVVVLYVPSQRVARRHDQLVSIRLVRSMRVFLNRVYVHAFIIARAYLSLLPATKPLISYMLDSITRVYRRGEARIMGACESIKIGIHIYVCICTMFVLAR